jgi:hypothetical protein
MMNDELYDLQNIDNQLFINSSFIIHHSSFTKLSTIRFSNSQLLLLR